MSFQRLAMPCREIERPACAPEIILMISLVDRSPFLEDFPRNLQEYKDIACDPGCPSIQDAAKTQVSLPDIVTEFNA